MVHSSRLCRNLKILDLAATKHSSKFLPCLTQFCRRKFFDATILSYKFFFRVIYTCDNEFTHEYITDKNVLKDRAVASNIILRQN